MLMFLCECTTLSNLFSKYRTEAAAMRGYTVPLPSPAPN
jgi:hypothetical protein